MPAAPLNLDLAFALSDQQTQGGAIGFGDSGAIVFNGDGSSGGGSIITYAALAAGLIALVLVLRR